MATMNELAGLSVQELINACASMGVSPANYRRDTLSLALASFPLSKIKAAAATLNQIPNPAPVAAPAVAPAAVNPDVGLMIEKAVAARITQMQSAITSHVDSRIISLDNAVSERTTKAIAGIKMPDVESEVSKAVSKAVAAAFKPIQAAFESAPAEVKAKVQEVVPRQRKKIKDVFDLPKAIDVDGDDTVEVWGAPTNFDADYIFDQSLLRLVIKAERCGDNIWLYGQRGTGKTEFWRNYAARTGRPFVRILCQKNMASEDFIGGVQMVNGSTVYVKGALLKAYTTAGCICLIDEISMVRSGWVAELHGILEPNSTFDISSTGEHLQRAQGMIFAAACNTNGTGDESGRFVDTNPINAALIDRFAYVWKVDFLPKNKEIELLVRRGAKQDVAEKIINVFTRCRAEVGNLLVEPPSLRAAFAFCKAVTFLPAEIAWDISVVNKSPEVSHEALRQLFSAHWKK